MKDPSKTLPLEISPGLRSATFSPESASGLTPYAAQAGPTISPSGPDLALANLSARQAKDLGLLTSGTYGQPSTGSSNSAALTSSLASKLRTRLEPLGSTSYRLTWRLKTTPAGRSFSQLVASARPISDKDNTGWATPQARDYRSGTAERFLNPERSSDLNDQVHLANWPTPTVGNAMGSQMAKGASATGRRPDGSKATVSLPQVASFAAWPAPRANDGTGLQIPPGRQEGAALKTAAKLAGPVRLTASGQVLTGSDAQMESAGQLNPAHSRWLMGLPPEWDDCGVMAMQSLPRKRKHSSKLTN